uniref:Uncharacterized protein n=1 Tax=Arundo donax TaxID=35708 RepID=A0A0A9BWL9_ARUDO
MTASSFSPLKFHRTCCNDSSYLLQKGSFQMQESPVAFEQSKDGWWIEASKYREPVCWSIYFRVRLILNQLKSRGPLTQQDQLSKSRSDGQSNFVSASVRFVRVCLFPANGLDKNPLRFSNNFNGRAHLKSRPVKHLKSGL